MKTNHLFIVLSSILLISCTKEDIRLKTEVQLILSNLTKDQKEIVYLDNNQIITIANPYTNRGGMVLKGSLHNHTDNSVLVDGYKSGNPREIAIKFKNYGNFDFFAFTDHNYVTHDPCIEGIVWMGVSMEDTKVSHHLVVYNLPENYKYTDLGDDINEQIAYYHSIGAVVSYAHPDWDGAYQSNEMIVATDAVDFVENLTPSSTNPRAYNLLLAKGPIWGVGTDDYHYNASWQDPDMYFDKSCIYVYADEKSREAIWKAIMAGCFYASRGTKMDINCTNGDIAVTTEIPSTIDVMGVNLQHPENEWVISSVWNAKEMHYQIDGTVPIVWIRVRNEQGMAYSQAFRVISEDD